MDKIFLNDLNFFAYHGYFEHEKREGQPFIVSLVLETDLAAAGASDDLAQTVNYADVYQIVADITLKERFDLIEALAARICEQILRKFPQIEAVTVKVDKPQAPGDDGPFQAGVSLRRLQGREAVIALGSNLGNTLENLRTAVTYLEKYGCSVVAKSRVYQSEPWGFKEQNDFLNAAVLIRTKASPRELLEIAQRIEKEMGRRKEVLNGPRNIDLDIALYEDCQIDTDELTIPHPRLTERQFVLQPLADIVPHWQVGAGDTVTALLKACVAKEKLEQTGLSL